MFSVWHMENAVVILNNSVQKTIPPRNPLQNITADSNPHVWMLMMYPLRESQRPHIPYNGFRI